MHFIRLLVVRRKDELMKSDWTSIMKKNKRLKLTTIQTLTHYGIVIFLLFIVPLTSWSLV